MNSKVELEDSPKRLAVLIDADNAQASVIEGLLAEIARYGEATVKRIYGDFTSTSSASWKKVLQQFAIKPVQQFAYSTGKNATDSSLIIDAMDLLYTRKFDGFCLITSDSDFTGLAMRLREEGITVYGFGEQKTPDAFRNACHKFVFTEILRLSIPVEPTVKTPDSTTEKKTLIGSPHQQPASVHKKFPKKFVLAALEQSCDDQGWANLGTFGKLLTSLQPDFDSRLYGYKKLSELVRAKSEIFIVDDRPVPGTNHTNIYLKAKQN